MKNGSSVGKKSQEILRDGGCMYGGVKVILALNSSQYISRFLYILVLLRKHGLE